MEGERENSRFSISLMEDGKRRNEDGEERNITALEFPSLVTVF